MRNKLIIVIGLMLTFCPLKVNALTGSVSLSCKSNTLTVNGSTTCTLSGNSNEGVTGTDMNLSSSGNISISNITINSIWQGNGDGGNIQLYSDNPKSGTFNIATFTVKAKSSAGTGTINVNNVIFVDTSFAENGVSSKNLAITVKNVETPKTESNNNQSSSSGNTINNNSNSTTTNNTTDTDKKSNDATLKSLTISAGEIIFSKDITDYKVEVSNEIENISIEAVSNNDKAKVSIPDNLTLKVGENNFSVKVTAEDGTVKNYNLVVIRLDKTLSNNTKLKSLKIDGKKIELEDDKYIYDLNDIKKSSVEVDAIVEDEKSSIKIYGNNSVGKTDVITIKVTAEDGSIGEYIIHVNNEQIPKVIINLIVITVLFIFSLGLNVVLFKKNKYNKMK